MRGIPVAILLCLLPSRVNALTALATCRSGYEWMFSSIGQSPCDVAVELASVCYGTPYQLYPLRPGDTYTGAYLNYDNGCLCSSVYYSLLSACAFCQGQGIRTWLYHTYNCSSSVTYVAVYPQQIPVGVKVPAYAYQDVSLLGRFNLSLAYNTKGEESSRPPPPTPPPTPTPTPTSSTTTSTLSVSKAPPPAVIGGVVVGGLIGLGLIAAMVTFLVLRSKQKSRSQKPDTSFQKSPDATSVHSGMNYNADPSMYDNLSPHFTGNDSTQHYAHSAGRYSGMPEL